MSGLKCIAALWAAQLFFLGSAVKATDGIDPDLVIVNARMIDTAGEIHRGMTISVASGRVVSVSRDQASSSAANVINAGGRIALPGFIDVHLHLIAELDAHDAQSLHEQVNETTIPRMVDFLRHGVTTIKSIGDPIDEILELRARIRSGEFPSPRLLAVGKVIGARDGHPAKTMFENSPWLREQINSEISTVEEARNAVRELSRRQVDAIKLVYSGNTHSETSYRFQGTAIPRLPTTVMQTVITAAHQANLRVTAHTVQLEEALAAAQAGIDGLEHGVVIEPISDELLSTLSGNGASYVPTLRAAKYFLNDAPPRLPGDNLLKAAAAGVRIVLGTDMGGTDLPLGHAVLDEAELMAAAGLSPVEVIRAMTINAAQHLGMGGEIGSIAANRRADIVLVDGDPLTNISDLRKIWLVMKDGEVEFARSEDGLL